MTERFPGIESVRSKGDDDEDGRRQLRFLPGFGRLRSVPSSPPSLRDRTLSRHESVRSKGDDDEDGRRQLRFLPGFGRLRSVPSSPPSLRDRTLSRTEKAFGQRVMMMRTDDASSAFCRASAGFALCHRPLHHCVTERFQSVRSKGDDDEDGRRQLRFLPGFGRLRSVPSSPPSLRDRTLSKAFGQRVMMMRTDDASSAFCRASAGFALCHRPLHHCVTERFHALKAFGQRVMMMRTDDASSAFCRASAGFALCHRPLHHCVTERFHALKAFGQRVMMMRTDDASSAFCRASAGFALCHRPLHHCVTELRFLPGFGRLRSVPRFPRFPRHPAVREIVHAVSVSYA